MPRGIYITKGNNTPVLNQNSNNFSFPKYETPVHIKWIIQYLCIVGFHECKKFTVKLNGLIFGTHRYVIIISMFLYLEDTVIIIYKLRYGDGQGNTQSFFFFGTHQLFIKNLTFLTCFSVVVVVVVSVHIADHWLSKCCNCRGIKDTTLWKLAELLLLL